ncbi:MAG: NADPH-dependent 7-cyano-7-deazaguanine reductase QueF [Chlamydiota bacterium]
MADPTLENAPLGEHSEYLDKYSPELLYPLSRAINRADFDYGESLPFQGVDIWNAYELSWLNSRGKPEVAIAEFRIPCISTNLVESKSFKLYLNSFNQTVFTSLEEVKNVLQKDLSVATGATVEVSFLKPEELDKSCDFEGECLDHQNVVIDKYKPYPAYLQVGEQYVAEQLYSHLLKTNCPKTGQPDWANVYIKYSGPKIDRQGLLKYIVSYRTYAGFHEHSVEKMFVDILHYCKCDKLTLYARYTRRGGLDINPYRTNFEDSPCNRRSFRQ